LNVVNDPFGGSNNSLTGCQSQEVCCHQIIHPELCANSVVFTGNVRLGNQANL